MHNPHIIYRQTCRQPLQAYSKLLRASDGSNKRQRAAEVVAVAVCADLRAGDFTETKGAMGKAGRLGSTRRGEVICWMDKLTRGQTVCTVGKVLKYDLH